MEDRGKRKLEMRQILRTEHSPNTSKSVEKAKRDASSARETAC